MKLQSKRLCTLWDHNTYHMQNKPLKKPIDGLFIYHCLFSVEAFASRPEQNITTKLSKMTAEKLLQKVRELRNDINQTHRQLLSEIGNIDINIPQSTTPVEVTAEQRCFTPGSVMLMKVFMASDEYFTTLYKARLNGELTELEVQRFRKQTVETLNRNLQELNKTCLSFHKVRKQAESST